jgi:hypothetical protein
LHDVRGQPALVATQLLAQPRNSKLTTSFVHLCTSGWSGMHRPQSSPYEHRRYSSQSVRVHSTRPPLA